MIIPSQIDENSGSIIEPETILFRGFSDKEELVRIKKVGISPMSPIKINPESPSEIVDLLNNPKHREHVLEREKGHFVSFSLREKVARQYATTDVIRGRKKSGYIAMIKFPNSIPVTYCGEGPYMYKGFNGTITSLWIDLRHFPVQGDIKEWNRVRQRTVGDNELLLVCGVLHPFNIVSVNPDN